MNEFTTPEHCDIMKRWVDIFELGPVNGDALEWTVYTFFFLMPFSSVCSHISVVDYDILLLPGQSPVASEQEPVREQDDVMELHSTPDPMATPTAVKALIRGDRRGSSVVKYKITATPGYSMTSDLTAYGLFLLF